MHAQFQAFPQTIHTAPAYDHADLDQLIQHIEETHHAYTRDQLLRIAEILADLDRTGTPLPAEIRQCCNELESDLVPHLMKEEQILFPYIVGLVKHPDRPPHACFGSIANPIGMMNIEHDILTRLLTRLRGLTNEYTIKPDQSQKFSCLYQALQELDADLVCHMYLEDDVLFPRAMQMEHANTA